MVMEGIEEDMGDGNMICTNHPYKNNTPGGICAFCLQEKLGKLVSSSFPSAIFPSSSSSSTPSFRSDHFGVPTTSTTTTTTTTTTTSTLPSLQTNQTNNKNQTNVCNNHYGKMRKSRMPFLLSSHYNKKKKDGNSNGSVIATMKRSKSTTIPRNGMHFLNEEEEDYNTPHRRRFWSFLYYSSSSKQQHSKKTERNMTFPSVGNGSMRSKKKEEEFVVVEENENESSPAVDRKVSRSRSVGCGSRSFSGDFFERISTGFGDCTLRRVESQREGNNKSKIHHRNSGAAAAAGAGQDCIKERVRCGGLFSGFMITSSSSSSSSSSHWVSSEENMNGKSGIAPVGQQQQQQLVHGRNRSSWGWAFASPMRAFSKTSSSNGKRGASNKNATTPNLAAIPSLLTARG
ncbi:uncharacterized protein DDB_G0271670-like [Solanum tuberosum]|uniref:Uncharacterized protein n=1 Tax=Solanum tuberosum TaxID=4113 RepID=M1DAU4_SOLTU|nr:PREDICTED: uncharacterized protein DDB_G0271670-like [Solanum tuberosum]KAH0730500.1 hypothetical protein KY289_001688 [Solanum tuberosum]